MHTVIEYIEKYIHIYLKQADLRGPVLMCHEEKGAMDSTLGTRFKNKIAENFEKEILLFLLHKTQVGFSSRSDMERKNWNLIASLKDLRS